MDEKDTSNPESNDKSDDWKSWPPDLFLATLLHELRTPIMTIKGYTQILANETHKEIHPKAIESISHTIDRFEILLNDIATYYQELTKRSNT